MHSKKKKAMNYQVCEQKSLVNQVCCLSLLHMENKIHFWLYFSSVWTTSATWLNVFWKVICFYDGKAEYIIIVLQL